ncbi:hypothetical protein B0H14DRAFT_2593245 [Mycena olivaceomarginata]|nr:hypothetical protein B0H14DRAFT_2593245 [Mycena olivaceomarginata]
MGAAESMYNSVRAAALGASWGGGDKGSQGRRRGWKGVGGGSGRMGEGGGGRGGVKGSRHFSLRWARGQQMRGHRAPRKRTQGRWANMLQYTALTYFEVHLA